MSDFKVTHEQENGVCVCCPSGRLDGQGAPVFEAYCQERIAGGGQVMVLDFSGVGYVSSAGLRCLLVVAKKLQAIRGRLALCGMVPMVEEVMKISGFHTLLTIRPTRAEAVAAVTEPKA